MTSYAVVAGLVVRIVLLLVRLTEKNKTRECWMG